MSHFCSIWVGAPWVQVQSSWRVGSSQAVVSLSKGREAREGKEIGMLESKDHGIGAGEENNRIPGC